MSDRRKRSGRGVGKPPKRQSAAKAPPVADTDGGVEVMGWTILAHPLFLEQIEHLLAAAEREARGSSGTRGPNTKLLAHLLDLAFDKVPRDPGNSAYRQGNTLGLDRKHWFRAVTGNGRYRLFYRFQSRARIIFYAWINDESSLRTYGSRTDAYAVFARMLDEDNPPDDWDALVDAASTSPSAARLRGLAGRKKR
jgi:toxin YhaV